MKFIICISVALMGCKKSEITPSTSEPGATPENSDRVVAQAERVDNVVVDPSNVKIVGADDVHFNGGKAVPVAVAVETNGQIATHGSSLPQAFPIAH